ncbi:MAG TPA: hypothetical protein VFG68_10865 [Fimbriiglobus sp.]|nr:hypothetical protein [Fimbriiglobus sp.]
MTPSSNIPGSGKAAISIKEMAALVSLSRQRFMQLVKAGVMPAPLRDEETGRPYYTEELQITCLEVRRRNVGINGKVVMFYARRTPAQPPTTRKSVGPAKPKAKTDDRYADIVAGLHGLGLTSATAGQVADAVATLYPAGAGGTDTGEVIRRVFLHLRGKNTTGNVGGKE